MDSIASIEIIHEPATPDAALEAAWQSLGLTMPLGSDASPFFAALGSALSGLAGPHAVQTVGDVFVHVDYLAAKAACSPAALLRGEAVSAEPSILRDALLNIAAVLRLHRQHVPAPVGTGLPPEVETLLLYAEERLEGWCTRDKAVFIAETILAERPSVCVEIGVYGGRSLVPAAAALRYNGGGVIYGIEAWTVTTAIADPTEPANDDWWPGVDFAAVKHAFYRFASDMNLTRQIRLVEVPSARAAGIFDTIDYLHIDGSHSMFGAAEDVLLYVRKVRPGGIVLFDDADWATTKPAQALLEHLCEPVRMLSAPGGERCAVMRRRGTPAC